jgi:hypothetical protein
MPKGFQDEKRRGTASVQFKQRRSRIRRLLDAGPSGIIMGLLMAVTAALAIAILIWMFYVVIKSVFSAF